MAFFLWRQKRGRRDRERQTQSLSSLQSFDDRDMKGQKMMGKERYELSTGVIHVAEIDGSEVSPGGS